MPDDQVQLPPGYQLIDPNQPQLPSGYRLIQPPSITPPPGASQPPIPPELTYGGIARTSAQQGAKALPYAVGTGAAMLAPPTAVGALLWAPALAYAGGKLGGFGEAGIERLTGSPEAPQTFEEAAKRAEEQGRQQAWTELGGRATGQILEQTLGRYFNPSRLYQSGLKPPPSWGKPKIERIVQTGLRENIPLTEAGGEKAWGRIQDLNNQIAQTIAQSPTNISPATYVRNVQQRLDALRTRTGADATMGRAFKDVIDRQEREFLISHGKVPDFYKFVGNGNGNFGRNNEYIRQTPDDMSLADLRARARPLTTGRAQEIKKQTYETIRSQKTPSGAMSKIPGWDPNTHPNVELEAREEIARALREELGNIYPQLHKLNARDSDLIQLDQAIDRYLAREGNKQLLPYFTMLAGGAEAFGGHVEGGLGTVALGLTAKALENPGVKSYIAIALDKARKVPGAGLARRAAGAAPAAALRYFQYQGEGDTYDLPQGELERRGLQPPPTAPTAPSQPVATPAPGPAGGTASAPTRQNLAPSLAQAIARYEGQSQGARAQRNNNPGNLKFAHQPGATGPDKDGFAVFKSYDAGYQALVQQVNRNIGRGMNLQQFFASYAPASDNNKPLEYARTVGGWLGLDPRTRLSSLQ